MPGILYRDLALYRIPQAEVDRDISIFFNYKYKAGRLASDDLPIDWPGDETINLLVLGVNGLFIYAAIICRFIE